MKSTLSIYILLLGCFLSLFMLTEDKAQVITGNVTLSSQSEVNAFSGTSITGYLYISGADITDLTPLSSLTSVGGNLKINNDSTLQKLDGLTNITSVGGGLDVDDNSVLQNLDSLSSITSIGGFLYVYSNSKLDNLNGLIGITSVGGGLEVVNNSVLANLDGLSHITTVVGFLDIDNNPSLTNLDSLSSITSVGGDLYVRLNSHLTNIDGLSHINSTVGNLEVYNNSALTNLNGLSGITSAVGNLEVYNNSALTNLNGLSGITSVGQALDINNNSSLQNIDSLSNITSIGGFLYVYNNANLTNLNGLSGITSVGGTGLEVFGNSSITNLDGLNHITSVSGFLEVNNNSNLTNLDGLSYITSVGGNLYVQNNTVLSDFCGLFTLLNSSGLTGTYNVSGNSINPTEQSIIDSGACSALPVELASFTAGILGDEVNLHWKTQTEINNYGFEIQRENTSGNSFAGNVHNDWTRIGFVKGAGNSNSPKHYSFTDQPTGGTSFSYRLKQIDNNGKYKYYDAIAVTINLSQKIKLMNNYPNPFNPSTAIKFYLPKNETVTIKIYDVLGKVVKTLVNNQTDAGYHIVYWNGKDSFGKSVASGMYIYRLSAKGGASSFVQTKKMILLK